MKMSAIQREYAASRHARINRRRKRRPKKLQTRELESLARGELRQSLGTITNLQATLEAVATKVRGLIRFDAVVIYLLDERANALTAAFADASRGGAACRGRTLDRGDGCDWLGRGPRHDRGG